MGGVVLQELMGTIHVATALFRKWNLPPTARRLGPGRSGRRTGGECWCFVLGGAGTCGLEEVRAQGRAKAEAGKQGCVRPESRG